jgi:hypothetical protein
VLVRLHEQAITDEVQNRNRKMNNDLALIAEHDFTLLTEYKNGQKKSLRI